jgi:hypothetical protein
MLRRQQPLVMFRPPGAVDEPAGGQVQVKRPGRLDDRTRG